MTTATLPKLTKRVEYDRPSRQYAAFVIFEDGSENLVGYADTQHDASLLASESIISYYNDHHTPERAAELIHEELAEEGRHEELARQMGAEWEISGDYVSLDNEDDLPPVVLPPPPPIPYTEGEIAEMAPPIAPDVYQAFVAADNAWQAELERLFGRNAGDVRYTEEGRTGTTLAPLYAEFRRTCAAWHDAMGEISDEEHNRTAALFLMERGIDACTICGDAHRPTQCPEVGALLMRDPYIPNELPIIRAAVQTALRDGFPVTANALMEHAACLAECFVTDPATAPADATIAAAA